MEVGYFLTKSAKSCSDKSGERCWNLFVASPNARSSAEGAAKTGAAQTSSANTTKTVRAKRTMSTECSGVDTVAKRGNARLNEERTFNIESARVSGGGRG